MRFWYDPRLRSLLGQALAVFGLLACVGWLANNGATNLQQRGIAGGFDFLWRSANFTISESLIPFSPTDTILRAIVACLLNTALVAAVVIVVSTVLGLAVALGRRSRNPVASNLATIYLETIRNTPLVVQMLFWYAAATFALPAARRALNPLHGVYLSQQGVLLPRIVFDSPGLVAAVAGVAMLAAIGLWIAGSRRGMSMPCRLAAAFAPAACAVAGLAFLGTGWSVDYPARQGFSFAGGIGLTLEFSVLVVGLSVYSAAFCGEVIRGGIDAIGRGQWEAAAALGLPRGRTLRLVILPQALRVIIPPMTNQYFSIVKNTTLAQIVGYPDLSYVMITIINQTGRALETVAILMALFLGMSISITLAMNWYNKRYALVSR